MQSTWLKNPSPEYYFSIPQGQATPNFSIPDAECFCGLWAPLSCPVPSCPIPSTDSLLHPAQPCSRPRMLYPKNNSRDAPPQLFQQRPALLQHGEQLVMLRARRSTFPWKQAAFLRLLTALDGFSLKCLDTEQVSPSQAVTR